MDKQHQVEFDYTNHRGIRRHYRVTFIKVWYGKNEWYPSEQHLLKANVEGKGERNFAMSKIRNWSECE